MLDRETTWALFVAGFTGTAHARRFGTRLARGPVRGMRFTGGEERPNEPFDDFFVRAADPAAALAALTALNPLTEHYLTVLDDRPGLVADYEDGGYRLSYSESLMVRDLRSVEPEESNLETVVARAKADADWLNAHDPEGLRWISPDNLTDPRMSHYSVIVNGRPVARGRTLRVDADHCYVSRVYTAESLRRRGLGRSLVQRMLADDANRGARWSVLMSSAMAVGLYAGLGYQTVGTTRIFEPSHAALI
jgi:GNAT superfamily N-acetyltransferase